MTDIKPSSEEVVCDCSDRMFKCPISQCEVCQHWMGRRRCAAFEEIPFEIWDNQVDHREPYPNDCGIRFEWNDAIKEKQLNRALNRRFVKHY